MGKNKRRHRAYKQRVKKILLFSLKQLILISLFAIPMCQARPMPEEECTKISIVVEDVDYTRVAKSNALVITSNSVKYRFPSRGLLDREYSNRELQQMIRIGDKMEVIVVDNYSTLGKTKLILDARTETEVYRSLEVANAGRRFMVIFIGIFFVVFEILFLIWQAIRRRFFG